MVHVPGEYTGIYTKTHQPTKHKLTINQLSFLLFYWSTTVDRSIWILNERWERPTLFLPLSPILSSKTWRCTHTHMQSWHEIYLYVLIYFARYKINMCVGIRWSLNQWPFSNQWPNGDFHWSAPLVLHTYYVCTRVYFVLCTRGLLLCAVLVVCQRLRSLKNGGRVVLNGI